MTEGQSHAIFLKRKYSYKGLGVKLLDRTQMTGAKQKK